MWRVALDWRAAKFDVACKEEYDVKGIVSSPEARLCKALATESQVARNNRLLCPKGAHN